MSGVMNKPVVLVIGGAGYIGSHTAYLLTQQGFDVVILDSLVHKQRFDHSWATFIYGDFSNNALMHELFQYYNIQVVMHFAAFIEVGESVKYPQKFYRNNVINAIQLLDIMHYYGVKNFIFSSSCAVYGTPQQVPINETHQTDPESPYGRNKLAVEFALHDYSNAYEFRYVSLRYFNAAGAFYQENLGEWHDPETHVIPCLLRAAYHKKNFYIFGGDYQTSDGSCVRDYIHVIDIARAHVRACQYLLSGEPSVILNLGTGAGYSVKQVISCVQQVCNIQIKTFISPRRAGDVAILIADFSKARKMLSWMPENSDLMTIVRSAYEWEKLVGISKKGKEKRKSSSDIL
jgi:UDP-glucose 4-epimerase